MYLLIEKASKVKTEIVERKGFGHPDTLCDQACELASKTLSNFYLTKFNEILHHNVDKAVLIAGSAKPKFGGGILLRKPLLLLVGRATTQLTKQGKKIKIPVKQLIEGSIKQWLNKYKLPLDLQIKIAPGSLQLQQVSKLHVANDTSFGIAHWPLSKTEQLVLHLSKLLESTQTRKRFPFIGLDTKLMAYKISKKLNKAKKTKQLDEINLIAAIAFIDKWIYSAQDYVEKKEKVKAYLLKKARLYLKRDTKKYDLNLSINLLDAPKPRKESDCYLTVTGLSCEQADDGNAGRGNRVWQLISACNEQAMESCLLYTSPSPRD